MPTDKQKHTEIASEIPCGLKPCPFCGFEADVTETSINYFAECPMCYARGPEKYEEQSAGKAWNTRADASPWVAIDDIPKEWVDEGGPNEGYVDVINSAGCRFPDARQATVYSTVNGRYSPETKLIWISASGHEIFEPTHAMIPTKTPAKIKGNKP